MARVGADDLADKELARVYIAATLKEAALAEDTLCHEGVDYVIDAEPFVAGFVSTPRPGIAFYVLAGQASFCRDRLISVGLGRGVVNDGGG